MRSTRMHRGAAVAAAALLTATFAAAAPASAEDHEPDYRPAPGQYSCEVLFGGEYWTSGLTDHGDGTATLVQTCTVVDDEAYSEIRPGSNPNSGFQLDVEVSETTVVYTNTNDFVANDSGGFARVLRTTTEDVTEEVTINACYNSAGNVVQGDNNPNCTLP